MNKKQLVRHSFREAVFKRDGHKCVFCDIVSDLDAHHITDRNQMPNGGYVKENGVTLCSQHHLKAELHHQTGSAPESFRPEDLYKLVDSSYEQAYNASLKLN